MQLSTAVRRFIQGDGIAVIIHCVILGIRFDVIDIQAQGSIGSGQFVLRGKPENTVLPIPVLQDVDQMIMLPVLQGIRGFGCWGL
ncbi:hypothetical protein D3C71_1841720 [compost metagenome]